MKVEKVINALLTAEPTVTAAVGAHVYPVVVPERIANQQRYVVYAVISNLPMPTIDGLAALSMYQARVQVTCTGGTYADLKQLVEAVKVAAHLKRGVIAGVKVISSVLMLEGPEDFDDGLFLQPVDFLITYEQGV